MVKTLKIENDVNGGIIVLLKHLMKSGKINGVFALKQITENTKGTAILNPGLHRLCFIYSQGSWGYGLQVEYEGPGIKRQVIPENVLFHAGGK